MVRIINILLIFLLLLIDIASADGQVSNNPFDLNHRKNTSAVSIDTSQQENPLIEEKLDNPFDISAAPPKKTILPEKPSSEASPKDRSFNNLGFLFWVFLAILLAFSSIYGISKERIKQIYTSFLNENLSLIHI